MKKMLCVFSLIFMLTIVADVYSQNEYSKAADFTKVSLDGDSVTLSEILKEKTVVLVFWTTWCPSCREEIPHVERFYNENKNKIAVIGINTGESEAKVGRFLEKNKLSYPVVLDPDSQLAREYGIFGIPAIIAVDSAGNIIYSGHSIDDMKESLKNI